MNSQYSSTRVAAKGRLIRHNGSVNICGMGREGQKRNTNEQLLAVTDPAEALRLHNELASLTIQLETAE